MKKAYTRKRTMRPLKHKSILKEIDTALSGYLSALKTAKTANQQFHSAMPEEANASNI